MLTLQFVPYSEMEALNTEERIKKLLGIVKSKSIVMMQGRLKPAEESRLIQETMEQIDKDFKGIEICTIYPEDREMEAVRKIKKEFFRFVLGNRDGMTIVGPSSIIKEIKRDPNKIQLYTVNRESKKSKKRR
ncbi:DUF2073 domain-containing protein [Candidatus Woesearchaeota archaeon]|nr:DUF2073 domain-containing protein [Candidatus Woesearchaeota archaeon]